MEVAAAYSTVGVSQLAQWLLAYVVLGWLGGLPSPGPFRIQAPRSVRPLCRSGRGNGLLS